MLRRLLAAGDEAARFRRVLLGGGPIPADLVAEATGRGVGLVRTYGLTETFGGMVHDGHPLDGAQVRIADPEGEVLVRGPMLFRRYRGDPGRTAAALRDGWLRTGDLGGSAPTGGWPCSAGPTTWSSAAGSTSTRTRSRRCWPPTRVWPRPP